MKAVWKSAVLSLAVVLGGCSSMGKPVQTYDGPARSLAEVAVLDVPEEVKILSVDGKEGMSFLLGQRQQIFHMLPGERVLTVRYVEIFQISASDHEVVRSRPVAIRFVPRAGEEYGFVFDKPKDLESAREFAKAPVISVVEKKTGQATQSVAIKSYGEASLVDSISRAFEGGRPEAVDTNLNLLKDVWGRASKEERDAFRQWISAGGAGQ